jgi:sialate O-acetylesterase
VNILNCNHHLVLTILVTLGIFAGAALAGEAIAITQGMTDYQVFQRDANNQAGVSFSGTYQKAGSGKLRARVTDNQTSLIVLDWQEAGSYSGHTFQGTIKSIPVGGPYEIELAFSDASAKENQSYFVRHILVGDLWILAGQSNMQGIGELANVEEPSIRVGSYGFDEKWNIASDPLHWLLDSIDPVHHLGLAGKDLEEQRISAKKWSVTGAGLGLPFAKEMVRLTGIPIGLIPCAHGGTSMDQWDPAKKDQGGNSLYGSMYRRFLAAGGKVKGVLWYQGEADCSAQAAQLFHDKFTAFVAAVRGDFHNPDMPFYFVQLGRYINGTDNTYWNDIRELQRLCGLEIPNCRMVAVIDLDMDDPIHVCTDGHKRLGKRLANLALKDLFDHEELSYGPQLDSVLPVPFRFPRFRLTFKEVNGKLSAAGRASGFSIRDSKGNDMRLIYKTAISADGKTIDIFLREQPGPNAALWYGYGLDPYCNIVDERDMPLTTFGPLRFDQACYNAFMQLAKKDVRNPALFTLMPQATAYADNHPESIANLLPIYQEIFTGMKPKDRLANYPYLFGLGDFTHWEEWLTAVREATFVERKRLAIAFSQAASFSAISCRFVQNWQVVGSFNNTDDLGFDNAYSPEADRSFDKPYTDGLQGPVEWKTVAVEANGYLDFMKCFTVNESVVAYALMRVEAQRNTEVPLLLGSDDAAAVWVNGKEVSREHQHRSARAAEDLMLVHLVKGSNTILIKVDQGGGDWGLYVQLVDKEGILKY